MSLKREFVLLDKNLHCRETFKSGKEQLDRFLKVHAAKHMEVEISRTYLLPASTLSPNNKYQICSFFTIAPSTISRTDLPPKREKKLPHYPVPVLLIAQLAVHSEYQDSGLGKITLIQALQAIRQITEHMPSYAVIVDCLDDEARDFYLKYGFNFLCMHNGKMRLYLPIETVRQLF